MDTANIDKNMDKFAEETIINGFLQIARVDLMTGEFVYLKKDSELSSSLENVSDIYEYMRLLADERYVFPEYVEEYSKFSDPEYVRGRIFGGEKKIVFNYRRKLSDGGGKWVVFTIQAPEDCSEQKPWVVFSLMESDIGTTALTSAMSALSMIYHKILSIDLVNDSFEIIKTEKNDRPGEGVTKITDWFRNFAIQGNVHEEDLDVYFDFVSVKKIKEHFLKSSARMSCRYRRRCAEGGYRWAQMDLIPGPSAAAARELKLILFVKDVHDEHIAELHHRQELIDNFNRDALTLLYNRRAFQDDEEKFKRSDDGRVCCLYIDANGLHEMNNHLGHQKGDDMLCCIADTLKQFFPDDRVYRIGGDEFVVLSTHLTTENIARILPEIRAALAENNYEISAGAAENESQAIYKTVGAAELAMRRDKEEYYRQNAHIRRKRTMNEELEQILAQKQDEEYFLKLISSKYAGVYYVDMDNDTIRYIYIPDYFKHMLQNSSFSFKKAIKLYAEKYVQTQYYDGFLELTDPVKLRARLDQDKSVIYDYRKVDGVKMTLKITDSANSHKAKNETVWIFTSAEE